MTHVTTLIQCCSFDWIPEFEISSSVIRRGLSAANDTGVRITARTVPVILMIMNRSIFNISKALKIKIRNDAKVSQSKILNYASNQ